MGDLLKAVKTGNSEKVKDLIEKGALEGFRDDVCAEFCSAEIAVAIREHVIF